MDTLPTGVHLATEPEVLFRFGSTNRRRRRLAIRLKRWLELARSVRALRFLVDGSFVTEKGHPDDVDAVVLLPHDFQGLVDSGDESALELEGMLVTRQPEEIFAAEDVADWNAWVEFFSCTRELDARTKGLVEVML